MNFPLSQLEGRNPEELTLAERRALTGHWLALPLYSPANLALRRVEALGASAADCRQKLRAAGKDPAQYEVILFRGAA